MHDISVRLNSDATTTSGAVQRGVLRAGVLLGLAGLSLFFLRGETESGNRAFLWSLAGLLVAICLWGIVETIMEVHRVRRPR